jgi:hypothetical protein
MGSAGPVLAFIFVLITQLLGIALISPLVALNAKGDPLDAIALFAFTIVPYGLLGLVVLGWTKIVEGWPLASIGLSGESKFKDFVTGHAIGMLSIAGLVAAIYLSGGLRATGAPTAFTASSTWRWLLRGY